MRASVSKRAAIMVIDACGVGSMPDWADYEESAPSNTLRSTCQYALDKWGGIKLPNLQKLGIANILDLPGLAPVKKPEASYGKMAELNNAKDTITGHWEMMGIKASKDFPYYPRGFPDEIIDEFKKQTGVKGVLGNKAASGTEIINELGDEHCKTGFPIIYTSADSVLQIACHVDIVNLDTQYKWCKIAREIMRGKHEVARIISRPFTTNKKIASRNPDQKQNARAEHGIKKPQKYIRLNDKRHDYSVLPHSKSVLETVIDKRGQVIGFGKIQDIFAKVGVPNNIHTDNNADGLNKFIQVLQDPKYNSSLKGGQVLFINLVETDSNFGHRRDPEGFAKALEAIDERIPEVLNALTDEDLFFITADHGCDPCAAGSDHTREYVPLIVYNNNLSAAQNQVRDLGTRETFADVGATVMDWLGLQESAINIQGASCL